MNLVRAFVAAATAVTLITPVPAAARAASAPAAAMPALQTLDLAVAGRSAAGAKTRPFSLLGATWADHRERLTGTVQVRTRPAGSTAWTRWQALESDGPDAAEPGSEPGQPRGSTDPVWVGPSDGVQARVLGDRPLPAGLRLDLINPDAEMGDAAVAKRPADVDIPRRPAPRAVTRAGWRADEQIVRDPPEYTTGVQVVFVHHTATANGYSCSQSPAIVRGIENFHVRSRGWNDIGYNFLVDKCGTLFEGRKGGITKPVLGAHTLGFNAHSAAIAVIGNYDRRTVPSRVRRVIEQVAAYKIGMYKHNPATRTVLVSSGSDRYKKGTRVRLNRISGHRDTGRTTCPGDALYGQLRTIRAGAGAGPTGLEVSLPGTKRSGTRYYTNGALRPAWTLTTPTTMINRFDIYVDRVLHDSLPRGTRTFRLPLSPGRHEVAVQAVHLSGRTATISSTVMVDTVNPAFSAAPDVWLRRGSLASAVPVRLGYRVGDAGGLRSVTLTSPQVRDLGVTARSWVGYAPPGVVRRYRVLAVDRAGNAASASVLRTPVVLSEAGSTRTGTWKWLRNSRYLGGTAFVSGSPGATLSWSFTGSSAQVVVSRAANSGRLRMDIDGQYYRTLDLRATRRIDRTAVVAPRWSTAGDHTVTLTVEGTAGRPVVAIDSLTVLQ